jgi:hypothetical protein
MLKIQGQFLKSFIFRYTELGSTSGRDSNRRPIFIAFGEKTSGAKTLAKVLLLISLLVSSAWASVVRPLPQAVHDPIPLRFVGEGSMTWFGFTLYRASLWTATGQYDRFEQALPIALHITYDKNIRSQKLVDTTIDEWERLKFFDDATRKQWGQKLSVIWLDVTPGDSITILVTTDKHTLFYANDHFVGHIQDPSFSYALLSIWLHPDTVAPELRASLIGKQKV